LFKTKGLFYLLANIDDERLIFAKMSTITLLTDFGSDSPFPVIAHSLIDQFIPGHTVRDINHDIVPFSLAQSKYFLKTTLPHFPINSYHFVLTDLYGGANKKLLYVYEQEQHIFSADNGFMTLFFNEEPMELFKLKDSPKPYTIPNIIHRLCECVSSLEQGDKSEMSGIDVEEIHTLRSIQFAQSEDSIDVQVLHIDRFENVIFNIREKEFEDYRKGRKFKVEYFGNKKDGEIFENYNDVPEHELLTFFNIAGYLELAMNRGSAAGTLGYKIKNKEHNPYDKVRIKFFE